MAEPNPSDEVEGWAQRVGGFVSAAKTMFQLYTACIEEGFKPDQAMQIVTTLFKTQLELAHNEPSDDNDD